MIEASSTAFPVRWHEVLLRILPVAVVEMDPAGALLYVNPAAHDLLEVTTSPSGALAAGVDLARMVDDTSRPIPLRRNPLLNMARRRSPVHGQIVGLERSDATTTWLQVSAEPMYTPEGAVGSIVVTMTDITIQRQQAATVVRQQLALMQAARSSSLGFLAAGVAHEIRNPLTIIQGVAVALRHAFSTPTLDVDLVSKKLERLQALTQRIATVVRSLTIIAAERSNGITGTSSLAVGVALAMDVSRATLMERGIQIEISPLSGAKIACQEALIGQLVINLMISALAMIHGQKARQLAASSQDSRECVTLTLHFERLEGDDLTASARNPSGHVDPALDFAQSIVDKIGGALRYDDSLAGLVIEVALPRALSHSD